ncbi:DUF3800 domain-containing protein [Thiotrichales bacterium 19S3-7]|nr:DUF3800 domain-containing protein [Thiotrichales bacterium 19S3-7]MCF6803028.1 DUF3800 domain-containing protein [Thiotrichales bacterium 19S3-11]
MKIVYADEAGDPGYPEESPCFIVTLLYFNVNNWGNCFEYLLKVRRDLKSYGLPIRLEFHTREFFLNKKPYYKLQIGQNDRKHIIHTLANTISYLSNQFNLETINVAIIKKNITANTNRYDILEKAFEYGLRRIDNNLYYDKQESNKKYLHHKFLLMIDNGYEQKIRKLCRKLYRYQYVPYEDSNNGRNLQLSSLIDDPIPKNSKNSYFIQLADFICYIVSQYIYIKLDINQSPKRKKFMDDQEIIKLMSIISPAFNLSACKSSPFGYGIYSHP